MNFWSSANSSGVSCWTASLISAKLMLSKLYQQNFSTARWDTPRASSLRVAKALALSSSSRGREKNVHAARKASPGAPHDLAQLFGDVAYSTQKTAARTISFSIKLTYERASIWMQSC